MVCGAGGGSTSGAASPQIWSWSGEGRDSGHCEVSRPYLGLGRHPAERRPWKRCWKRGALPGDSEALHLIRLKIGRQAGSNAFRPALGDLSAGFPKCPVMKTGADCRGNAPG
eukprot:1028896-Rhodomonas_salina.2